MSKSELKMSKSELENVQRIEHLKKRPKIILVVEMGALGSYLFRSFLVNDPFRSCFSQSLNKFISFVLKNIVNFPSILFVFSLKNRSRKSFVQ